MDLSPTAHVILGMVRWQPRSGYEIKALVDTSTRFFWAASYGQIYPELKRLSEEGLIEGVDEPQGGRRRTRYSITASGREALEAWLRRPPEVLETRDEGLLKLFFAGALPREDAVEIVRAMREQRLALMRRLQQIEPALEQKDVTFPLFVLRRGIEMNQWIADWTERVEKELLEHDAAKGGTDV